MNQILRTALYGLTATAMMAGASAHAADSKMMAKTASQSSMKADVPMVGGAPMYPTKTIVQNASQAKNLTTLVSAVKQAGLVDTLSGAGPFTVFAPTNKAFGKLPKATVAGLMKPAGKDQLTKILTYHVISGDLTAMQLKADIKKGNGKASFKTVEGGTLTFEEKGGKLMIVDGAGHAAAVTQSDVKQSNGNVFVINSVLMPS